MSEEPTHKPQAQPTLSGIRERGWVTLKDFAVIADVSYYTVLHWARTEQIRTFQAGHKMRVYEEEIARFLRHGTLPGNPEKLAKLKAKRKGYVSNAAVKRAQKHIYDKF